MAPRSSPRLTPYQEQALIDQSNDEAQRLMSSAIAAGSGLIEVLVPYKSHRSGATGHEFGIGNQSRLEAQTKLRGFNSQEWVSLTSIKQGGGSVKAGEESSGVRVITARQSMKPLAVIDPQTGGLTHYHVDDGRVVAPGTAKSAPVADPKTGFVPGTKRQVFDPATNSAIVNPETGVPDPVKVSYGPRKNFAMIVYNLDQTENYHPPHKPLAPTPGRRLPAAINSIWKELGMDHPKIVDGAKFDYNMGTDTITMPPREAFQDHRNATCAAFELTRHLAYAAGHPSRANLRMFNDPSVYAANPAQVEITAIAAASIYMKNHCDKWDPQVIDQSGLAEMTNLKEKLADKTIDLPAAMSQATQLYKYMAFGSKKT